MKTTKNNSTGEMDWEEGLEDLFGIAYDDLPNGMIGITPTVPEIKAFIRTTLTIEYKKGYNRGYEDCRENKGQIQ